MTTRKMKVCFLAFYDNHGNILLNHRKDGLSLNEDVWELMGGSVDEGEKPLDAIKREVMEELNYEIDPKKDCLCFIKKFKFNNRNIAFEVHFFKAKFPGLQFFSDSDEAKVSDLKLFPVEKALTLPLLPIAQKILVEMK